VAEALVSGESVQRFAETQGVGIETVRTHMKRVLAKTGVKRQADFIVRFSTFKSLEKAGGT
jgi:DNA-binding CsgD family transcriptional regulator